MRNLDQQVATGLQQEVHHAERFPPIVHVLERMMGRDYVERAVGEQAAPQQAIAQLTVEVGLEAARSNGAWATGKVARNRPSSRDAAPSTRSSHEPRIM